MAKPLRIFISSPGDVSAERRRAALVVESLKKEFARFFDITAYLWEHEAMLATGHFQDVIAPPSQSDIVVLILWSRLGTPLPVKSGDREYKGIDGRSPVTGTEWEYEDALAANRTKGAPDLLVYRSNKEPQISLRDPEKKALAEGQWNALETFWSRYFQAGGVFLSAFHGFDDLEDFGDMLEAHLRQLIRTRIEKGRIEAGAENKATWLQSPFRGLSSYDFEHAPIFFGRGAAQLKAVEQVVGNANAGKAFLLVLGASGSGKSSLVRAGLLPNLFTRGVADGVGLWRRVMFKPGDAEGNLFQGLARALTENRVKDGVGLPELLGPGVAIDQLENALRRSIDDPSFVFAPALGRVTDEARKTGRIMAHESAKLTLVLDQLEEVFTDTTISTEERNTFIRLIASLSRTGLVWVIATMRSDFWHKAAAAPELVELAEGTGRMDLLPPSQAELAEMIRRPAIAAGLTFEDHPETKIGLDAVIAEEAARDPGSLPLVSFMLDALYKVDIEKARGTALTYETYKSLGGIKGAIAKRADEILTAQGAEVQAAFPSVLRALVTVDSDRDQNATARVAPLSAFPLGTPRRSLVDAFLDPQARLLIADGDGGEARVRVAHEALINHWTRAREQINRDRRDLETRARLEEDEALWRAAHEGEKKDRLLEGLALEEGKDLVAKWDDELPQSLKDYIEESRTASNRKRRRSFRIMTGVAAVMAVLAVGAGGLGIYALGQNEIAQAKTKQAEAAEQTAEGLAKEAQLETARLIARQSYVASKDGYSEQALALAVESVRIAEQVGGGIGDLPRDAVAAIQHAASTDTIISVLSANDSIISDVEFGSDASTIYTGGNQLVLWDTFKGAERLFFGTPEGPFVTAVADYAGKYLAVMFGNKTLQIYDGKEFQPLGGSLTVPGNPTAVEIDAQGRLVMAADDQGTVGFVDPATQNILGSSTAHQAKVTYLDIADNLGLAVSADVSGRAVIWDTSTYTQKGTVVHGTEDFPNQIDRVVVSPRGDQFMLIGGGWASVYNAAGELVHKINPPDAYIYQAIYTPDGSAIIYGGGKAALAISTETFALTSTFQGHTFDVRELEISRDGTRLLTSSGDNTLRLWDVNSASTLRVFRSPKGSISGQGLSPDGNYVAGVFDDGNAVVWSVDGLAPLSARLVHEWNINALVWSPDGSRILTTSGDGSAMVFDAKEGYREFSLESGATSVSNAFYTADGKGIVTADNLGKIKLWSAFDGSEIRTIASLPEGFSANWAVPTPDGKQVLVAIYGGVKIYDIDKTDGPEVGTLSAPFASLFTLAVSPDGTRVVSGALDGRVITWDLASRNRLFERREDRSQINSVNFSPDGKKLVTASSDRTIRVWDAATGASELLLSGHEDFAMWAAYSADGQKIVSGGFDATVRLWDATTGAELTSFTGPGKPFRSAMLNKDGTLLAAAGDDRRLYLWQVPEKNFANTPTGAPILASSLNAEDGKLLKEMIAWAPLSLSKPLSPTDRRDNHLQPDPQVRTFDPGADACHQLAAWGSDPERLSPGVREGEIDATVAVPACQKALEAAPDDKRLKLQLGRALVAAEKIDEGMKKVQEAADAGYPGAIYYLGFRAVFDEKASADVKRKGWENVRKAWDMGLPDAGDLIGSFMISGQKTEDGQEVVKIDVPGGLDMMRQASQKGSWFSSGTLAQKYEYGENELTISREEALYYYALAARQMEIEGFVESTEARRAAYQFARRASIARVLVREGKSAEVAAIAGRVAQWVPPVFGVPTAPTVAVVQ